MSGVFMLDPWAGATSAMTGTIPDVLLLEHIRIHHPDAYGDGPQCWPDGSLVVVDTTLEPSDFRSE